MFAIQSTPVIAAKYCLITRAYQDLVYTDEPIVFCGRNAMGQRVLGSIAERSMEEEINRYFHVLVDSHLFSAYINRRCTYLDILNEVGSVYVIDEPFSGSTCTIYHIPIGDIPAEYLPTKESFYPESGGGVDIGGSSV